eukprot:TRINITY_DN12612_c0_g1_i1.p1 TRINITY_DN12612_c0_g1~~TRINITY_DN12612_c0_g1_i1.p1  ORF type:complete len:1003 (+),score=324.32 TRINITY_DN12612_c0_g1_i1:435-3011(+)
MVAENEALLHKLSQAEEQVRHLTASNQRLRNDMSTLEDELADLLDTTTESDLLHEKVESQQAEIQHLQAQLAMLEAQQQKEQQTSNESEVNHERTMDQSPPQVVELSQALEAQQTEQAELQSQLREAKNVSQTQLQLIQQLQQQCEQLKQANAELQEQYNTCSQQLLAIRDDEQQTQLRARELHADLLAKEKQLRQLQEVHLEMEQKVAAADKQAALTGATIAAARSDKEVAEAEVRKLEEELQAKSKALMQLEQQMVESRQAEQAKDILLADSEAASHEMSLNVDQSSTNGTLNGRVHQMSLDEVADLQAQLEAEMQANQELRQALDAMKGSKVQHQRSDGNISNEPDANAVLMKGLEQSNLELKAQFKDLHQQFKEELVERDAEKNKLTQRCQDLEALLQASKDHKNKIADKDSSDRIASLEDQNTALEKRLTATSTDLDKCRAELAKKEGQLAKLQQHLLTLEEQHTIALLEAQEQASSAADQTHQAQSELAIKFRDVSQRYEQTQQRVRSMEQQITLSVRERDAAVRQAKQARENEEALSAQLTTLQAVLRDFEDEKESTIGQVTLDLESQLAKANARVKDLELELVQLQRREADVASKLTRAEQELSTCNYDRGLMQTLEHDNNRLRSSLDAVKARLSAAAATADEDLMDLSMIKNTVKKYFHTTDKVQKQQVLRVLAGLCDFTERDSREAGLTQPTGGFLSTIFGSSRVATPSAKPRHVADSSSPTGTQGDISSEFVEFLLSSSNKQATKQPLSASQFPQETASVALQPVPNKAPPRSTAVTVPASARNIKTVEEPTKSQPQRPSPPSAQSTSPATAGTDKQPTAPVGISLPGLDSSFTSKKSPLELLLDAP